MPIERNRIDYVVSDNVSKDWREWWYARGMPQHLSPGSTFIGAMGNHWREGCYAAVKDMAGATFEAGVQVTLYEQPDRCYWPGDALGTMRNEIYMTALAEGYQYVLYVDNDVMPEPGALLRLLTDYTSGPVAPRPRFPGGVAYENIPASSMDADSGLYMVGSCIISMVLFPTALFRPFSAGCFWADAIGADEEYHFDKMYRATGHRPYINTGVTVDIVDPPHFPLDARPTERSMNRGDGKGNALWRPKW